MNFISLEFLVFFPVVFGLYWILPGKSRWIFLLAASYFFYINRNLWSGVLLLSATAVSYIAAWRIADTEDRRKKQAWLAMALVFCLSCLVLFKGEKILVAGISFYIFQSISYMLDVYRGRIGYEKNFGYYALFVSFFPQLVAGPIERTEKLLPQLKRVHRWNRQDAAEGIWLILRGFFKKLAAADYLAGFVNRVYESPGEISGIGVILGTVLFAGQIYCDFSGYTDIARGTARMMGIHLMENFDHPYRAGNIREFWRRWHISLTKWFTDYVYIPLGGSRKGIVRQCLYILTVFLLSGLWHGLSFHYVVWGLFHGILLAGYTLMTKRKKSSFMPERKNRLSCAGTFSLVCFSWIFFRAETLKDAQIMIGQIFFHFIGPGFTETLDFMKIRTVDLIRLPLVFLCLLLIEGIRDMNKQWRTEKQIMQMVVTGFCMILAIGLSWLSELAVNGGNAFIYFKF